ncbi:MAG: MFS transporter [Planctomycetes bacterium]|nr:MFS transporter [Planctomycetota bacterium]
MSIPVNDNRRWYEGITRYQWLVLLIASLGWIFDIFEGQIFVASMNEAMKSLLPEGTEKGMVAFYNDVALGAFLLGGALGGVFFGALSDRIGRTKTMIFTILMYSCFTCVTVLAQTWWQMAGLRFLVAMGVGGEWAVASAMVAEVFPKRARAWSGAIFHGSSVFGTFLAVAAGMYVVANPNWGWRWGFAIGALPALLTLWIRWRLREPDKWIAARAAAKRDASKQTGRIGELFSTALIRHTLIGVTLAAVGLATFWGVHIYGKDLMRRSAEQQVLSELPSGATEQEKLAALDENFEAIKHAEMIGMLLTTTGGGIGLLAFAPLCEWIGRRGAFLFFNLGGLVSGLVLFQVLSNSGPQILYIVLPVFGFLSLGMHAGYAIYFPELFPTRLRGTGGGFCFNAGRILAAPILFVRGWMRREDGLAMSLDDTASVLCLLFLVALVLLLFAPETKGRDLPE